MTEGDGELREGDAFACLPVFLDCPVKPGNDEKRIACAAPVPPSSFAGLTGESTNTEGAGKGTLSGPPYSTGFTLPGE